MFKIAMIALGLMAVTGVYWTFWLLKVARFEIRQRQHVVGLFRDQYRDQGWSDNMIERKLFGDNKAYVK